jgi:hypothetical protein
LNVRLDHIIGYREAVDDNGELTKTTILLSNGESYLVNVKYNILKEYIANAGNG